MKLTAKQFVEVQKCKSPEEALEKAKALGFEMTLEEAKAVLAKAAIIELDENDLAAVTGGNKLADHVADVYCKSCGGRAKYRSTINCTHFNYHSYLCDCGYETTYFGDEFYNCQPFDISTLC